MNSIFKVDEKDLQEYLFKNYRSDRNYNKDLDVTYDLEIAEGEKGTEKSIKIKQDILVCKKGCDKCRNITDKTFNLLEKNCGRVEERDTNINVKIPNNIQDGQSIVLAGQGRRENNKCGNLKVIVKVR